MKGSLVDQAVSNQPDRAQNELRSIFFSALDRLPDRFAERDLIFALWRLNRYDDVRDQVLRLLQTMPWRSSALIRYLQQFEGDPYTIERITDFVSNHRVYGWHLKNCVECLFQLGQPSDTLYTICREWVLNTELPWYQRLAAAEGLSQIQSSFTFCNARADAEENYMVRKALFSSSFKLADDSVQRRRIVRRMLLDSTEEIQLAGIYFLYTSDDLSWPDFAEMEDQLGSLRNLIPELVPDPDGIVGECYIAKKFVDFFGIDIAADRDFEPILSGYYDNAKQHLRVAIGAHDTSPSRYVSRLDNFNNMLVWAIYDHHLQNENYSREDTVNNSTFAAT